MKYHMYHKYFLCGKDIRLGEIEEELRILRKKKEGKNKQIQKFGKKIKKYIEYS